MSKSKVPRADALAVAEELIAQFGPAFARVIVAGSIRRERPMVGDVEILFIPNFINDKPVDFFSAPPKVNLVDRKLADLIAAGDLAKRANSKGAFTWGPENKLAIHTASGISVDFFETTADAWFNYLVCRTGGSKTNIAICEAARRKGWKWNPTGTGFSHLATGDKSPVMESERAVFEFVGMEYREPKDRE